MNIENKSEVYFSKYLKIKIGRLTDLKKELSFGIGETIPNDLNLDSSTCWLTFIRNENISLLDSPNGKKWRKFSYTFECEGNRKICVISLYRNEITFN